MKRRAGRRRQVHLIYRGQPNRYWRKRFAVTAKRIKCTIAELRRRLELPQDMAPGEKDCDR
jgi:hypothetical protein